MQMRAICLHYLLNQTRLYSKIHESRTEAEVSPSLIYSIKRVRDSYLSNSLTTAHGVNDAPSKDNPLKQIEKQASNCNKKQTIRLHLLLIVQEQRPT